MVKTVGRDYANIIISNTNTYFHFPYLKSYYSLFEQFSQGFSLQQYAH